MFQDAGTWALPPEASLPWHRVWLRALQPSEETYASLVADPRATAGRGYLWVAVATFLGGLVGMVIGAGFEMLFGAALSGSAEELGIILGTGLGASLVSVVCFLPVVIILSVVGLTIWTALNQFFATALGGSGSFDKMLYANAAYNAPLGLLAGVLSGVPLLNCLAVPLLSLYGIALNVVATKAVHRVGWGQAFAASVVVPVGLFLLIACGTILLLALLGPAIGNVFSNIMENI